MSLCRCGVAGDEEKRDDQTNREQGRGVVSDRSVGRDHPDDRRSHDVDPTQHEHDAEPSRRESELASQSARPEREDGDADRNDQEQTEKEPAHHASLSDHYLSISHDARLLA
jgi:hypothetical protein